MVRGICTLTRDREPGCTLTGNDGLVATHSPPETLERAVSPPDPHPRQRQYPHCTRAPAFAPFATRTAGQMHQRQNADFPSKLTHTVLNSMPCMLTSSTLPTCATNSSSLSLLRHVSISVCNSPPAYQIREVLTSIPMTVRTIFL